MSITPASRSSQLIGATCHYVTEALDQGPIIEHVIRIVDIQVKDIASRLVEQGLTIDLSLAARRWLAEKGFDAQFGARPLRRALQRYVESPLSKSLLKGEFKTGDVVVVMLLSLPSLRGEWRCAAG